MEIKGFFESLESNNVTYVVPRGFNELPEQIPGGDIDLLVDEGDFSKVASIARECGFSPKDGKIKSTFNLGLQAVSNPRRAVKYTVDSPEYVARLIKNKATGNVRQNERRNVRDWRASNKSVMIHLRDHLAYTSPWRGGEYRVDPRVEEHLFKFRQRNGDLWIPSPPDELAHLICRGVFDREGHFPEYYIGRCREIEEMMTSSQKSRFKDLLSLIFFEARDLVYNHIVQDDYNSILESLKSHSDY